MQCLCIPYPLYNRRVSGLYSSHYSKTPEMALTCSIYLIVVEENVEISILKWHKKQITTDAK